MNRNLKVLIPTLLICIQFAAFGMERTKLLPSNLKPHVRIANLDKFRKSLDEMVLNDLRNDKQFQEFSAAVEEKIKKKSVEGRISLGICLLYEQLSSHHGEVILAFGTPPSEPDVHGYYLVAAMSEEENRKSRAKSEWLRSVSGAQVDTVTTTFQSQEIVQNIADAGTPKEVSYWQTCLNGTLLLSHDREWIERNIVTLNKKSIEEPRDADLRCYLPLGEWLRAAVESEQDADKKHREELLCKATGLFEIGNYSINIHFGSSELIFDETLEIGDLNKGIFTLFDITPTRKPESGLIPVTASSFSVGKFDLQRFWQNLPVIMAEFPPLSAARINGLSSAFKQKTGIDFEHDLLAHMGKTYFAYTVPSDSGQQFAIALELTDGKAIQNAIDSAFSYPAMQVYLPYISITDFRRHALYSLKINSGSGSFSMCATDNYLLFGDDAALRQSILGMDSVVGPEQSRLQLEAETYTPSNAFIYGAIDHKKTVAMLNIKVSDTNFSAFFGVQSGNKSKDNTETLGENEISMNYIGSFLHKAYYYVEAANNGIHHRIVFKYEDPKE